MINSNFNFRTALNEIKETKQSQNAIKVDNFLRKIITEINDKDVEISKEMLDEMIFLQYDGAHYYNGRSYSYGQTVMIYIRKLYYSNNESDDNLNLDSYLKILDYTFSSSEEASIILKMTQGKLKNENFEIKLYDGENSYKNGQSFILRDIPR